MKTLFDLFLSFLKIGFFSFGGTTMIPVINDEVLVHGWMTADEVMDIVAVAEMTPGSLGINCATFVGLRTAGILGALSASLAVMMPSLTLCMLAAHFIMKLKDTGLTVQDIKDKVNKYMIETYERFDFLAETAKGMYIYDENGTPYLDFYAGIAVNNAGNRNPKVVAAVKDQVDDIMHTFNYPYTIPQA